MSANTTKAKREQERLMQEIVKELARIKREVLR